MLPPYRVILDGTKWMEWAYVVNEIKRNFKGYKKKTNCDEGESGHGESGPGESDSGESGFGESGFGGSGFGESGSSESDSGESGSHEWIFFKLLHYIVSLCSYQFVYHFGKIRIIGSCLC